ncbi:serine hydrolase domain-containing protein [Actinopolymorpha alba]|uniref:serine hydrolase domain-containing protein n=1 Tax=Actinopolymorpha alba TaxID=533267 RepID=UPI00038120D3|nr:serine hydrolase [Actinopolymorpha alba]
MDLLTGEELPCTSPEEQGIPASAVLDFVTAVDERIDAVHAFVLVRHGHVVAQGGWAPHDVHTPRMLFSLSKSFTSSAVGLAVDEGLLSVDDLVLPFFASQAPDVVSDNLARLRVEHLLTMTAGHASESLAHVERGSENDWVRSVLAQPVEYEPGTRFVYNSGASYLLSAIVQRVTGLTLLDYLRPRLLSPLGITDATWQTCPRGINTGGWGLTLRTTEIARFGQLYLQGGRWRGKQVLPRSWVAAATARQVSNDPEAELDWRQGYGYQFWRCQHDAYRGDGAFGQFCVVMPEQDAVLAVVSGVSNMQSVLDLAWEHLLPAMGPAPLPAMGPAPLPADPAGRDRLDERLAGLTLSMPAGRASSPTAARVSGRTYRVLASPSVAGDGSGTPAADSGRKVEKLRLDVSPDDCRLTVQDSEGVHEVSAGTGEWRSGSATLEGEDRPVAARATWTDDDTCVLRVCAVGTPFVRTITLVFDGGQVTMTSSDNVAFEPLVESTVIGQLD